MSILFSKRFGAFFAVQFLGALNDNIFRVAFSTLLTYYAQSLNVLNNSFYSYILSALFILPFLIFSDICGQLADKYPKNKVILWVKLLEIIVMLLAFIGLFYKSLSILLGCIFILGLHSTLFAPVKYSYLGEHFSKDELIKPNAWVEMSTFLAILCGSILGTLLAKFSFNLDFISLIAVIGIILASLGYILAKFIPQNFNTDINNLKVTYRLISLKTWHIVRQNKMLFFSTLTISWLWFIGVIFLNSFFSYTKDILQGNENILTLLLALFSIGIGLGSFFCEKLSKNYIELGLVSIGAIGISIFTFDLYLASKLIINNSPNNLRVINFNLFIKNIYNWRIMFDFFMISFCSGIFSLPLYAIMQASSPTLYRSRIIAFNNIINAIFMVLASLLAFIYLGQGYSLISFYLLIGVLNLCVVIYIIKTIPTYSLRLLMVLVIRIVYRLKVNNLDNIPQNQSLILACNHVSFMDALIIGASIKKPIHFIMDNNIANLPYVKYIFKLAKVVPIASGFENKDLLRQAYHNINQLLKNNEIICIFPEGEITKTGEINPLKAGILKIIKANPQALIIPLAISGMWGSSFSRIDGRAFKKPLRRGIFNTIYLDVGRPITHDEFTLHNLRLQLMKLRRYI